MEYKEWLFCEDDMLNWKPLADPDKPELPYRPGLHLSIRRHVPIPPFSRGYISDEPARRENDLEERCSTKLTDWALRNPPSQESPPHPDPAVCDLEVLDAIACKDGRGAQLVRCRVGLDGDAESIYVAKIYDPFYYSYLSRYSGPCDVTWQADKDYSREAAAYETLHAAKADGQLVPTYFGSWTFDLPVPEVLRSASGTTSTTRPVRMILLAWVPNGVSLDTLAQDEAATKSIPPALRLEVAARAMEIFCRLESHGVRHNDFAARNVIVSPASPAAWTLTKLPTVLMIDFNIADITTSPYYKPNQYATPPLPVNPRYRFFGNALLTFGKWWIPRRYQEMKAINGWLRTRWREEEEGFSNPPLKQKAVYDSEKYVDYLPLEPDSPVHTSESGRDYHQNGWN